MMRLGRRVGGVGRFEKGRTIWAPGWVGYAPLILRNMPDIFSR